MTQPKLAHATAWGRMYGRYIGDEPRVPSITTVLAQAPDGLSHWHGRVAGEAMKAYLAGGTELARFPHITEALETARRDRKDPKRAALRAIAATGAWLADQAAQRGDRVHDYAEQVALFYLGSGTREAISAARETLKAHGELDYARQFDDWWRRYEVKPVFAEASVWNHSIGYAGTIDIGFISNAVLIIADYKSKESWAGHPKALDPKVALQLVAGMNAEEYCICPDAPGAWEPWNWSKPRMLVGIGVSDAGVDTQRVDPGRYSPLWTKFQRLQAMWQSHHELDMSSVLAPLRPPPTAAMWPDQTLVELDFSSIPAQGM
ncbi:hypothetical protein [Nocardia sp. NPDC052566]|uniref:hypothetical protein n=1 Tax=Nocardia sp. NPDC052566 TaxID=3364330 RepID=UPI0037C99BC6